MYSFKFIIPVRRAALGLSTLALAALTGCATGPQANPNDPLEPLNRSVFQFNEGLDRAILKPVAQGYRAITPQPVRAGVTNFHNNLQDLWTSINAVLQLRPQVAVESFMRFSVNSTLGLAGLIDLASEMGIERHREDFGKTLGRWGVPTGPYIVFPLLGPSTLRDSTTIIIESKNDPVSQLDHIQTRNSLTTLRIIDTRSNLLRLSDLLDEAALDKYSFTRDAFLQKRSAEIYRPGQANQDDYKTQIESPSPTK